MATGKNKKKDVGNKRPVKWIPSLAAGLMLSYRQANSLREQDVPGEETNGTNRQFYSPDALSQFKLGCSRKRSAAPLQPAVYAFRFASSATLGGGWGWRLGAGLKGQSHLRFVLMMAIEMQHYLPSSLREMEQQTCPGAAGTPDNDTRQ